MEMLVTHVKFAGDNRYYPADELSKALCKIKKSPSLNDGDIKLLLRVGITIVQKKEEV